MPQVLNRSKNASTLINNVEFTKTANGMISEEIPQELADYFLKMPNYVAVKPAQPKKQAATPPAQDSADAEAAANAAAAERQAAADAAESAERQAAAEAAAAAAAKQKA
jgi:regulator of protease activity HflC (stomatin/prohibitin superfamily)